jgi:hypothetical protein
MKKFIFILFVVMLQTGYAQYDQSVVNPGTGTGVQNIWPLNINWGYTRSAIIYYAADIDHTGGEIREIMIPMYGTIPNDSIPLKLYMMTTLMSQWGGDWSWDNVMNHALLQEVFDGKVMPNGGWCRIRLNTPITYNGTDNLNVVWETNWGGTGVVDPPTYPNKDINFTSRRNLVWVADNAPPAGTQNGSSIEFIPSIVLNIFNPGLNSVTSLSVTPRCNRDSVKWNNNASNDSIIVVKSSGDSAPYLFNGYVNSYSVGSTVGGTTTDTVIFKGKSSNFIANHNHTDYVKRTYYVWHYTTGMAGKFSDYKSTTTWGAKHGLYSEDFNTSVNVPNGWAVTPNVSVLNNHGNTGNGMAVLLNSANSFAMIWSSYFCGVDENTYFRFKYRYVNQSDYPSTGTAPANIGTLDITFSTPTGQMDFRIADTNHVQSADFATLTFPVGDYASSDPGMISFVAFRGATNYYLDLDDIEVYTTTGVAEEYVSPFTMYPNPVEDILTFETNLDKEYKITIMNLSGQIVKTIENITSHIYNLDVSTLPSGMYIVNIQSGKESKTSKFVKQ